MMINAMNLSSFMILATTSLSSGFVSPAMRGQRHLTTSGSTSIYSSSEDLTAASASSSSAVRAALDATKKYGAVSQEARVLWDIVDEMNRTDNSEVTKRGLDEECVLDENGASAACMEYEEKMQELFRIMNDYEDWRDVLKHDKLEDFKSLTQELNQLKMEVNSANDPDSPALHALIAEAVQDAKLETEQHGPTSSEAKLAWETVEELASSGLENAMGNRLDEECLVDSAIDACTALEKMDRVLNNKE